MSAFRRRLKALGTATVLAATSLVVSTIGATAAHASGCNDSTRLISQDMTTSRWGYIGYVEMDYSRTCKQISGHFHIDAGFYGNHSGWTVTTTTVNSSSAGTALVTSSGYIQNSDSQDFWAPAASIYGHPSETFTAAADWDYDGCKIGADPGYWDFSNGRLVSAAEQFTWIGYNC